MANAFMVLEPFALTFEVENPTHEQAQVDRLKALLDAAASEPLSNILQLIIEPASLRFRLLIEEGKPIGEQVATLETALVALGFPGRDGWLP